MPGCPSWSTARPTTRSAPAELAQWLERFVARGRRQHDRRLLRHRRRSTSPRSTRCCAASRRGPAAGPTPKPRDAASGCRRSPRSTARCRCARRTPICRSASAATPTARSKFRELQEAGDWDGCVAMGREQVKEGSHALDVCTAFVGRDEIAEMTEVVAPHARRGQRAAGDRLDRIPGARGRAEALWRQADHQLDQFRGRRGGRRPSG